METLQVTDAVLGITLKVPTLDDPATVTVHPAPSPMRCYACEAKAYLNSATAAGVIYI